MQNDHWNDPEIWLRIQQDDKAAYDLVYRRFLDVIFALVYKHIDSRQDAEDITQDVFLSVWEQRKSITLQKKIFSYLYSVARFKTYKYIKDKGLSSRYQQQWDTFLEETLTATVAPDAFLQKDMQRLEYNMTREIESLPPKMKQIYQLNIEEGWSIADISHQLIVSEHTVKKHLVNIKKRLRGTAFRLFSLLTAILTLSLLTIH